MILGNAFREYLLNFKAAMVFGLLLVFVAVFSFLANSFVGSGSIFFEYNLFNFSISYIALELLAILAFLLFYSFFVTLMVFSVRRNLSTVKLPYSLPEMIQKFSLKIFAFNALLSIILFVAANALLSVGIPLLVVNFGILLIAISVIFVPQAIVVDEDELDEALISNFEFIEKNFASFITVIVVGMILLAVLQLIEFFVDEISLIGGYVSIAIALIFIVPFIEALKTYMYMFKYDLIRQHEMIGFKKRG